MISDFDDKRVIEVAEAFYAEVKSDLLKHGGVLEDRITPLRSDYVFTSAVFDRLAIILAQQYDSGALDFEMADWLANEFESNLVSLISDAWPKGDVKIYPALWSQVYEAFDAGEHNHFGRSAGPVAEFTDPTIKQFVSEQQDT